MPNRELIQQFQSIQDEIWNARSLAKEWKVALRDLYNQYTSPRMYGIFEGTAKEALEREVKALKEAGIDIYIADLQKQLDAYYEEISK